MCGKRLLVLNLAMDADHHALGHSVALTNALAERAEHVSVITMTAGSAPVADNVTVHSLGKELGHSEPRRLVEFYRAVRRVIEDDPPDAAFAHMAPLFAALFAPVARRRRIPLVLWYAHSHVSPTLRVAHALSDRCVTSTPAGFQMSSRKLFIIGQGIDTERFRPSTRVPLDRDRVLLSIGRLSPVKRVDEQIEALALLERDDVRLEIVGGPASHADDRYAASLPLLARRLGVADRVAFRGPLPYAAVARAYHRGGILLNTTPSALDKTILEAMASGCIPVSNNPGFSRIASEHEIEALVPEPGAGGVAAAVARLLVLSDDERAALRDRCRAIVVGEHGLGALADRICVHLDEARA